MNHGTKNKLLTVLVVLLLIANAATLALFWMDKMKHPPQPKGTPQEFLVKELKLDAKQQEQLDVLRKEHREAADQLREKIKDAKKSFFDLLKQTNVTDSAKQAAAKAISSNTEALDLLTLNHFQKLRALCTPEQQNKFDKIIHEVARMISQPRPPGGPEGDRPPPPQN